MICTKCGAHLPERIKFCGVCGTKVEREQLKRRCISCGAELAENQLICTSCGMRVCEEQVKKNPSSFEKPSAQDIPDGSIMKKYENMHYALGKATITRVKHGAIVMYEDRIDLIKQRPYAVNYLAGRFGGMIGALIAAVVFAIIDAVRTSKSVNTSIFYSTIKSYERGKYGRNPSIIITLKNGVVYTLVVGINQDEIFEIIEENVTAVL